MGGDSEGHSSTIIENNYFITGPCWVWRNTPADEVNPDIIGDESICIPSGSDGKYYMLLAQESPSKAFTRGNDGFDTYLKGNYYDDNKDGVLNGVEINQSNWDNYHSFRPTFLTTPHYASDNQCHVGPRCLYVDCGQRRSSVTPS